MAELFSTEFCVLSSIVDLCLCLFSVVYLDERRMEDGTHNLHKVSYIFPLRANSSLI
jgi:hypothetical protein